MNSDEDHSEEDEEVESYIFKNRWHTLLDVKGNGRCLYKCLGLGMSSGNKSAADVQKMLYRMTGEDESEENRVLDFMRILDLKSSEVTSKNEAREKVKEWNSRLSARQTGGKAWGDKLDISLFSAITGTRVKVVLNSQEGLECIHDTISEEDARKKILGHVEVTETS
jgi:hypothetical protein